MSVTLEERSDAVALISRYARSVDAADIAAVLQCFTDDVALSYEGGRRLVTGRAEAEAFFRSALQGPSTHLLANYGFERLGAAIVADCSGIAFVCRKEGFVSLRGLVYVFTCVHEGSGLRIQRLEHCLTWACDTPGGPVVAGKS